MQGLTKSLSRATQLCSKKSHLVAKSVAPATLFASKNYTTPNKIGMYNMLIKRYIDAKGINVIISLILFNYSDARQFKQPTYGKTERSVWRELFDWDNAAKSLFLGEIMQVSKNIIGQMRASCYKVNNIIKYACIWLIKFRYRVSI